MLIMLRQGLNKSLIVAEGRTGHSSSVACSDQSGTMPWRMTHVVMAAVIAILFVSTLALKPVTMAGFPALGDLSADACSDMLDSSPAPPDMPFLTPAIEHSSSVHVPATLASLDRQPIPRPRLVSFPALPQGPPARS